VLNAFGKFTEASLVPVLMNVLFIAAMLLADAGRLGHGADARLDGARTGSCSSLDLGGSAAAGWALWPGRPRWTPELRRLLVIAGRRCWRGAWCRSTSSSGGRWRASSRGPVAWLSYADRLYQLPLGVVGIAIGTVLLPDLSRRLRAGDDEGGRHAFNRRRRSASRSPCRPRWRWW
jgi:putative peptidoglycan lipid II flippase